MSSFPRYIAIEGPIGVGKTTLTRMLAERLKARTVFEEFSDNPFLRDFYAERDRVAFQTQTYFLVARYKQQEELRQHDLFASAIVSDYLFAKDRIFAYLNLSDAELTLYEKIYELLRPRLVPPDLVVYLQARPEILLKRIKMRGRDMESPIDGGYLERLMRAYNQFFFHYEETPLLVVETSEIDFKNDPQQFESVVEQIRQAKAGTRYFVPHS
ncbi:MAG: deoxynucleoside kinase [Myxococcota bacterium]